MQIVKALIILGPDLHILISPKSQDHNFLLVLSLCLLVLAVKFVSNIRNGSEYMPHTSFFLDLFVLLSFLPELINLGAPGGKVNPWLGTRPLLLRICAVARAASGLGKVLRAQRVALILWVSKNVLCCRSYLMKEGEIHGLKSTESGFGSAVHTSLQKNYVFYAFVFMAFHGSFM